MVHPLPSPPFCHSKSQAAITSPLQPRNPTILRPPPHRCPAGASSPTTSSTAIARRPSSTSPDEDPSSISSSRRFSRPVLHLQGVAPTIASSIAAAPSPQRRLNLLQWNRSILTDSSDEAEAYSAPPKRLYTHRIAPSPYLDLPAPTVLHPAPPWRGYLEADTTSDISMVALPQCEAPSAAASIPAGSGAAALALARSLALLLLLRLSLDRSLAQLLLLLSPSLVLLLCSD